MSRYRHSLPQLAGEPVLTDGGLETYLIFHEGIDLPCFASFPVAAMPGGAELLERYLDEHLEIARRHGVAQMFDSNTWRANPDWVERVTGSRDGVEAINRRAVEFLADYRERREGDTPIVLSGCVGPRGDGYVADAAMNADQAAEYHRRQIETHAASEVDLVTAYTINYAEEAVGVARAAAGAGVPVAISFTVETDGRLPTGQPLGEAIRQVDESTDDAPAYYMINCTHPTHFAEVLDPAAPWIGRLRGVRANSSVLSHAELETRETLDEGDPADLGRRVGTLRERLPTLNVLGGCCGTDARHIGEIAASCFAARQAT